MREPWLTVILTVATLITAGGAIASYKILKGEPRYAEVTLVRPVIETFETPREVCARDGVTGKTAKTGVIAGTGVRALVPETMRGQELCHTVYETQQQTVAYDVTYRFDGADRMIRMGYDPGPQLKLMHGTPDVD